MGAKRNVESEQKIVSPARATLMLQAAEMYFLHDESRSTIGDKLGISRFKVARLLKEARELGLVNITLTRPDGLDPQRSEDLRSLWGLERSIVVPWSPEGDLLQLLAEAAASYLNEQVMKSDVLGLSSGRTTSRMSRLIRSLPNCKIVQIAGVAAATSLWESPTETIRRITQLTAGPSYPIYAPIVLSTEAAAQALRQEPGIADAYAHFPQLTKAVVTTAPWEPNESMIRDSVSREDQDLVASCGPAAEILANVVDADGKEICHAFSRRALSISLEQLRAVEDVILVSGGAPRRAAILACLRAGFINTLITDSLTAQYLIEAAGSGK